MPSRRFLCFILSCYCCFSEASLLCIEISADPVSHTIPLTSNDLQQMIELSHEGARERIFRKTYQDFFALVLSSPPHVLAKLPPKEALSYLSLFAQWRLLPPVDWSRDFFAELEKHLPTWSPKHFLAFAEQRKVSALKLPASFHTTYLAAVKNVFPQLKPEIQLEIVSTELYHGQPWGLGKLHFYINSITTSLKNDPRKLSIKSLKEMYRALLFLPSDAQQVLAQDISALVEQLELQLRNHYRLSLSEGGISGSRYPNAPSKNFRHLSVVMSLQQLFPGSPFLYEYSNSTQAGFYDPVDLLIPNHKLIFEWDGGHHYFRPLRWDGTIGEKSGDLVLRPLDRMRDTLLRSAGYRILRISPPLARQLDDLDIETLINEQNP